MKSQHFGLETALTMDNVVRHKKTLFSPLARESRKTSCSGKFSATSKERKFGNSINFCESRKSSITPTRQTNMKDNSDDDNIELFSSSFHRIPRSSFKRKIEARFYSGPVTSGYNKSVCFAKIIVRHFHPRFTVMAQTTN